MQNIEKISQDRFKISQSVFKMKISKPKKSHRNFFAALAIFEANIVKILNSEREINKKSSRNQFKMSQNVF